MAKMGERLRTAREAAGFPSARSAALHFHWTPSTYAAHENGQNEFNTETADKYARAFRIRTAWLLTGEGPMDRTPAARQGDDEQELWTIWDNLPVDLRRRAIRVLKALRDEETE